MTHSSSSLEKLGVGQTPILSPLASGDGPDFPLSLVTLKWHGDSHFLSGLLWHLARAKELHAAWNLEVPAPSSAF